MVMSCKLDTNFLASMLAPKFYENDKTPPPVLTWFVSSRVLRFYQNLQNPFPRLRIVDHHPLQHS
jgi:hypothetical protein